MRFGKLQVFRGSTGQDSVTLDALKDYLAGRPCSQQTLINRELENPASELSLFVEQRRVTAEKCLTGGIAWLSSDMTDIGAGTLEITADSRARSQLCVVDDREPCRSASSVVIASLAQPSDNSCAAHKGVSQAIRSGYLPEVNRAFAKGPHRAKWSSAILADDQASIGDDASQCTYYEQKQERLLTGTSGLILRVEHTANNDDSSNNVDVVYGGPADVNAFSVLTSDVRRRQAASCGGERELSFDMTGAARIGRYILFERLGAGCFGIVYRAHDPQLQRDVAIKIARPDRVDSEHDLDMYLAEACNAAQLDHPGIVPVYDVGKSEEGHFFIVSKLILGTDLAKRLLSQPRFEPAESAHLVAQIAEAIHHAHQRRIVHRDIKPANIMLHSGTPMVMDFGLALRDDYRGKRQGFVGTLAYMSPEQARGEGHRVDARSDIYSLGVILYELLTGQSPYYSRRSSDLIEEITSGECRPPRQLCDTIPKELERVGMKALAKRAADRYTTAIDLANDLRHWLAGKKKKKSLKSVAGTGREPLTTLALSLAKGKTPHRSTKVIPKGLRSYTADDADFFLQLLPGPIDRNGVPDSIRFWKSRIEATDADTSAGIGVSYGPSGCGKSSLFKAGVIPCLGKHVIPVLVEAGQGDTNQRVLRALRRRFPTLPESLDLIVALSEMRQGWHLPTGQKLCLIIDQFEQWLHTNRENQTADLVHALRQCDGQRVQCILLVRDDFWMSLTRLMWDLEVPLSDGVNSAAVDLFDLRHARKVLAAFGRAYGCLPEDEHSLPSAAAHFLDDAAKQLADNGKVIPVRLALFAEMVKSKAWTPATLREAGGAEGVGVTFLEETFSSSSAPPEHRLFQAAARSALKTLLPCDASDIKGRTRSEEELACAAGLSHRPREFATLLAILNSDLRLISPTELEPPDNTRTPRAQIGLSQTSGSDSVSRSERFYQLTHDYLVPTLREWLDRKQRETRRGRAELLLEERAQEWGRARHFYFSRPTRFLPTLMELARIGFMTRRSRWTSEQRAMMSVAGKLHLFRFLVAMAVIFTSLFTSVNLYYDLASKRLVEQLLSSEIHRLPAIIVRVDAYGYRTYPLLRQKYEQAPSNSDQQLRLSLALLKVDDRQIWRLRDKMLVADADEFNVICEILVVHKDEIAKSLWEILEDSEADSSRRVRAACALAIYDASNSRWESVACGLKTMLDDCGPHSSKWRAHLDAVYARVDSANRR